MRSAIKRQRKPSKATLRVVIGHTRKAVLSVILQRLTLNIVAVSVNVATYEYCMARRQGCLQYGYCWLMITN